MTLKSRFQGEAYRQSRPHYPASLFLPLRSRLPQAPIVLDLGAGTGYASQSFLRVVPQASVILLEPDLSMLNEARALLPEAQVIASRAEQIELQKRSVDLVLVGSAWHWMDYAQTTDEMVRVLNDGGLISIFEYQFPKALEHVELNEWVRRQFNLHWKAPAQAPRGSLREITQCLRDHKELSQIITLEESENRPYSSREFAQIIFSQSRFLHYEELLAMKDRENYRLKVEKELFSLWKGAEVHPFLYEFRAYIFQKRP